MTQPWYDNDTGTDNNLPHIKAYLEGLLMPWSYHRYFLGSTKCMLLISKKNVPRDKELFYGMGLFLVTGSRYIAEFIGEVLSQHDWMEDKILGWEESIKNLSCVADLHPQVD